MLKTIATAAVFAFVLPATPEANTVGTAPTPSAAAATYEAVAFCGPVIAVDVANKRFTCVGDYGPLTLAVTAQTRLHAGNTTTSPGSFADIKRGLRVDLRYRCSLNACAALDVMVNK